jgi:phosphoribosylformylglycinamidine synthase subunit PurL
VRDAVRAGGLATVHDIGDGGLAVALAECCIEGGLGVRVELAPDVDAALFGEGPGGVLVAGPREAVATVPGATPIGEVGGDELVIGQALSIPVGRLRDRYEGAIPALFA